MIFNSLTYLLFLVIVLSLYWSLGRTGKLLALLTSSIIFYGFWSFAFAPLMLVSSAIDYFAARGIDRSSNQKVRKSWLYLSLTCNLGLLTFFKYFYFVSDNVIGLGSLLGLNLSLPYLNILLPIGISFYTFQTISYTIDVYRGFIKPERSFLLFCNYVTFFPQLVAGPILRAKEVIWQLDNRPKFSWNDMAEGTNRILGGLFLKVVLADNLASLVDEGFDAAPTMLGAIDTLTLAYLFGLQIYFDFAAYSHIAIGTAMLMGIKFPENFNFPYIAKSPQDFWKRWHISLSSWIRDYLYLPFTGATVHDRSTGGLGDEVKQKKNTTLALFATWMIMGLWHGAAWMFVVWGLWHALLIFLYRITSRWNLLPKNTTGKLVAWALTINFVMLGWIPFRSENLEQAFGLMYNLTNPYAWGIMGLRENTYLITALTMGLVLAAPFVKTSFEKLRRNSPALYQTADISRLTFTVVLVAIYLQTTSQFIYFQF
jgi:alginate O-acetyltransferase complex protein AlgI